MEHCKLLLIVLSTIFTNQIGTDVQLDDVFCLTNFQSGFYLGLGVGLELGLGLGVVLGLGLGSGLASGAR